MGMVGGSEKGFVLITVIWLLILVALLSASFVYVTNLNARSKSNIIANAQAESVADGLIRLVAMKLWSRTGLGTMEMPVNGTPFSCKFPSVRHARITIQDAGGLVDLNAATAPTLALLFSARGIDRRRIPALVDALLDFRDADDNRRPAGAERSDYARLGLRPGPKNALIDSIEELDQVRGYDTELIERIINYVTIHKKRDGIDRHVAPVALLEGSRQSGASSNRRDQAADRRRSQSADRRRDAIFDITTDVETAAGGRFARHAAIRLTWKDRQHPYRVLAWKRVWPGNSMSVTPQSAEGTGTVSPCPFEALRLQLPRLSKPPINGGAASD